MKYMTLFGVFVFYRNYGRLWVRGGRGGSGSMGRGHMRALVWRLGAGPSGRSLIVDMHASNL